MFANFMPKNVLKNIAELKNNKMSFFFILMR